MFVNEYNHTSIFTHVANEHVREYHGNYKCGYMLLPVNIKILKYYLIFFIKLKYVNINYKYILFVLLFGLIF